MPHFSRSNRPSVRDVASRAGVSVGTVSHVLNHPDRVTEATRDRVEQAISELGFVRSDAARSLREGTSLLVGVVLHDLANPFFTEAARGIEDRLRESGCVPTVFSTDADPHRERDILTLLSGMGVRGVLLTPATPESAHSAGVFLRERGIPLVLVDHHTPGYPSVSVDDIAGAHSAMTHLLECGHRTIGFLGGNVEVDQAVQRRAGVFRALKEWGLPEDTVIEAPPTLPSFTADAGQQGVAHLLDHVPSITAFFCVNDQMAIGAMREIRQRGLRIPEDIAIVGYDDIAIASELITPLTTVHQPVREIGRAAADLLLRGDTEAPTQMEDEAEDSSGADTSSGEIGVSPHVIFMPELVVRSSTTPR